MALVQRCRVLLRDDDIVVRYGGEEFLVLMPGAPLRTAVRRAKKLRKALAEATYRIDGEATDETPAQAARTVQFTASIGVASRSATDSPQSLIARADRALYDAKQSGRDRVVSEKQLESKLANS